MVIHLAKWKAIKQAKCLILAFGRLLSGYRPKMAFSHLANFTIIVTYGKVGPISASTLCKQSPFGRLRASDSVLAFKV